MKKTLTINLGGTVYHIDEDAYHLLDNFGAKLLQKSEMRKDIVIELSYKGFG